MVSSALFEIHTLYSEFIDLVGSPNVCSLEFSAARQKSLSLTVLALKDMGALVRRPGFWISGFSSRERERERENAKSNLETPAAHNHPHYPLFLVKHYKDIGHHFGCNRGLIEPQIYRPSVSWVRAGRKTNTHEYVLLKLCMHTDDGVAFG